MRQSRDDDETSQLERVRSRGRVPWIRSSMVALAKGLHMQNNVRT